MSRVGLAESLLRCWWLLALLGALGLGVAYASYASAPKHYQSTVSLQLNPAARSGFLPYGTTASDSTDYASDALTSLAASYREVLRSRAFGQIVVQRLQLPVSAEAVAGSINAQLIPNTNILRMTVTWSNASDAQQLAKAVADLFITESLPQHQMQVGIQQHLADLQDSATSIRKMLPGLRDQRDRLDQAVAHGDLSRLPELNELNGRLSTMESAYAGVLSEITRTQTQLDTATILEDATPAQAVLAVPLPQALLMGLLAGLAVGACIAAALERLRDVVRSPEDVVALCGSAPLAAIGKVDKPRSLRRNGRPPLVLLQSPRSPAAEAFRILRTNFRFATAEKPVRVLVVTSAGPGEGKTLVASNLAIALAHTGLRVLLVDADIRRPSIHTAFGLPQTRGLVGLLHHAGPGHDPTWTSADQVPGATPSGVADLTILPSGQPPDHPSELLGSVAAGRLIQHLGRLWDLIIVDTPPVGPVTDGQLLAAQADGVLTIVRSGKTPRAGLRGALEALRYAGTPVLGVVLNDLRPGALSRYTTYGYYYSGYYGKPGAEASTVPMELAA
jgi:capsular exopolysaccharide synthesis family protein